MQVLERARMGQGGAFARSTSSENQVRLGQCGATNMNCSSSSLTSDKVCARRLTGGKAYLHRSGGQLQYVPEHLY